MASIVNVCYTGMLVVIVLAMALFVGLLILVAGVLCLTRYDTDVLSYKSHKVNSTVVYLN